MDPARRNPFLPVSIGALLLCLAVAPGCCKRCCGTGQKTAQAEKPAENGSAGVTVTKDVPHSKETIPGIPDRDATMPLPPAGDKAIHSHGIRRAGNDNGMSIHPGRDNSVK